MMTEKEIITGIGNQDKQREALADYQAATEAMERGDAKAIFRIYEKLLADRVALLKVVEILCEDRKDLKGHNHSTEIDALKEIATQAIDLAKTVIAKPWPEPGR